MYDSKELYILLILNIFNPLIVSIRKLGQVVKYEILNAIVHDAIIIFISDIRNVHDHKDKEIILSKIVLNSFVILLHCRRVKYRT